MVILGVQLLTRLQCVVIDETALAKSQDRERFLAVVEEEEGTRETSSSFPDHFRPFAFFQFPIVFLLTVYYSLFFCMVICLF